MQRRLTLRPHYSHCNPFCYPLARASERATLSPIFLSYWIYDWAPISLYTSVYKQACAVGIKTKGVDCSTPSCFVGLCGERGIRPTKSESRYLIKKRRTISPSNKSLSYRLNPRHKWAMPHSAREAGRPHVDRSFVFWGGGSLLTDNPKTKQVTELSVTCFSIQRRERLQNLQNHRKS